MVEHTIAVVEFWNQSSDCILVAVNFAKAYDSVQHTFASAFLRYPGVLGQYMVLLVALMCSPLVIEVCSEVQPDVVVRLGSGVRQGDPLSPPLFSVLTLALFYAIKRLHCQVEVLLYADDIPDDQRQRKQGTGRRLGGNVRVICVRLLFGAVDESSKNVCSGQSFSGTGTEDNCRNRGHEVLEVPGSAAGTLDCGTGIWRGNCQDALTSPVHLDPSPNARGEGFCTENLGCAVRLPHCEGLLSFTLSRPATQRNTVRCSWPEQLGSYKWHPGRTGGHGRYSVGPPWLLRFVDPLIGFCATCAWYHPGRGSLRGPV